MQFLYVRSLLIKTFLFLIFTLINIIMIVSIFDNYQIIESVPIRYTQEICSFTNFYIQNTNIIATGQTLLHNSTCWNETLIYALQDFGYQNTTWVNQMLSSVFDTNKNFTCKITNDCKYFLPMQNSIILIDHIQYLNELAIIFISVLEIAGCIVFCTIVRNFLYIHKLQKENLTFFINWNDNRWWSVWKSSKDLFSGENILRLDRSK